MKFLTTPSEFYQRLLTGITQATRQIVISTLYIGPEQSELIKALETRANAGVFVKLIMDANRGTRDACPHVQLDLRSPHTFRLPTSRLREAVGTYHAKFAVMDDTVIVTGANLSDTYFTNRQDRYVVFEDAELAHKLANELYDPPRWNISHNTKDTVVETLLTNANKDSHIYLSSPYMNISPEIFVLLEKFNHVTLITGSEECNAFKNAKGLAKYVPAAYESFKQDLPPNCQLWEYSRPGWSFHAKGIWVNDNKNWSTVIGSSNLGYRSRVRDIELSMLIKNDSEKIQKDFENISKWCRKIDRIERVNLFVGFLAKGPFRSFL